MMPSPFTSISVNHGYAARKHRDQYNAGESVLKAFGEFTGGSLLYWPDDDGESDVRTLPARKALCFDARREMVLFDGRRCHCVTPFKGERYSIVFFTAPEHNKVLPSVVELLVSLGATWPNEENQRYYRSLIAPPKGNSKSIRLMFGYEDLPSALQRSGTPLVQLSGALPQHPQLRDHPHGYGDHLSAGEEGSGTRIGRAVMDGDHGRHSRHQARWHERVSALAALEPSCANGHR